MSIRLNQAVQQFNRFDANRDGVMDKKEMARAALRLHAENNDQMAAMFGTFLQGGTDKAGLLPDFVNSQGRAGADNKLSISELAILAKADFEQTNGDAHTISSADFKALFPTRAGEGNDIDFDKLKETANDNPFSENGLSGNLEKLLQMFAMMMFSRGGFSLPGMGGPTSPGGNPWGGGYGHQPIDRLGGRPGGNMLWDTGYGHQPIDPWSNSYNSFGNNPFQNNPYSNANMFSDSFLV